MGGRGVKAKNSNNQITMAEQAFRVELATIYQQFATAREQNREAAMVSGSDIIGGGGIGGASNRAYKRCACCREYSIPAFSAYYLCPVCGWIDDPAQNKNPDSTEGQNAICLNEARLLWSKKNTSH